MSVDGGGNETTMGTASELGSPTTSSGGGGPTIITAEVFIIQCNSRTDVTELAGKAKA